MLYLILFSSKRDVDDPIIGYLPIYMIPNKSILRKSIFDPDIYMEIKDGGLWGIYSNKELANEHFEIESKWRNNFQIWMVQIPNFSESNNNLKVIKKREVIEVIEEV